MRRRRRLFRLKALQGVSDEPAPQHGPGSRKRVFDRQPFVVEHSREEACGVLFPDDVQVDGDDTLRRRASRGHLRARSHRVLVSVVVNVGQEKKQKSAEWRLAWRPTTGDDPILGSCPFAVSAVSRLRQLVRQ